MIVEGILTKEEEIESVCSEIRYAATKAKNNFSNQGHHQSQEEIVDDLLNEDPKKSLSLKQLHLGNIIAQGCNGELK